MTSNELGNLPDRELLAEMRAYENVITTDFATLNFTAAEATAMKDVNDAFEAALDEWDTVELEREGKRTAKTGTRKAVLTTHRGQRNRAYADTTIADRDLSAVGFPPRDTVKTPSPAPSSAPFGIIEYGKLKHTIFFRDSQTPDSEGKPKGMQSCEIWRCIGTAPTGEADFDYVADDTNSPYACFYTMADAGKKVWYILRWKSKSGEKGEWSETIEATVNG